MQLVHRFIRHFRSTFHDHLEKNGADAAIAWRDEWLTTDTFAVWKRDQAENVHMTNASLQEHPLHAPAAIASFMSPPQLAPESVRLEEPTHFADADLQDQASSVPETDDEFEAPQTLATANMCAGGCRPCTNMLRSGRCRRGDTCSFCHLHGPDARLARPPRSARIRSMGMPSGGMLEPSMTGYLGFGGTVGGSHVGMKLAGTGMHTRTYNSEQCCPVSYCACLAFLLTILMLCCFSASMGMALGTLVCILLGMVMLASGWQTISSPGHLQHLDQSLLNDE